MAIEYSLRFDSDAELRDIADALRSVGYQPTRSPTTWSSPEVVANIGGERDHFGLVQKAVNVRPRIGGLFTIDKFLPYDQVMDHLVRTVRCLLDRIDGNAVLLSNHDLVLLTRIGGHVTLTTRDDWWTGYGTPPRAEQLALPHTLSLLPII